MGRRKKVLRDTKSQKRTKKRKGHFGGKAPPVSQGDMKWDAHKTLQQNYKQLGIVADVNRELEPAKESVKRKSKGELAHCKFMMGSRWFDWWWLWEMEWSTMNRLEERENQLRTFRRSRT